MTASRMSGMSWGIVILTIVTAVIHLALGFQFGDTIFILNGLGYFGLLGVLYLPLDFLDGYRSLGRWALMGYAILTIILYFFVNADPFGSGLGLATKAIEVILVILLFMESQTAQA